MWAVGTLFTLVTIALLVALLVANLDAVKWEDLSRKRIKQIALFIGIAVALTTLFVLLAIGGASLGWTGFADKTFWDWLQLLSALAIPVVLAAAGLWFTAQQDARQQRIETQRAESEQEIEEQRTQDAALQAYLDEMSSLVIGKNSLRDSEEDSEVRTLARARTITVLGRLDPKGKRAVMQFLDEADLIQGVEGRGPIIRLSGADLSSANLSGANLSEADLSDAGLSRANLSSADLSSADLSGANLRYAALSGADLSGANLINADLRGRYPTGRYAKLFLANLRDANLGTADLRDADLRDARNLRYADLSTAYLRDANLSGVNLSGADLSGADLGAADLRDADLIDADLSAADLSAADLSAANLSGAEGLTKEKMLKQQAKSLYGAAMPDGTVLYATSEFDPALSFTHSDGWQTFAGSETPAAALFSDGPEGGELNFTSPLNVFDPTNPSEPKELPAPENTDEWVWWFQKHPNLDTSKPGPASVGGAAGKQIDVTASSTPENYPRDLCGGEPCVPLYPISESRIVSYEGFKDRFIILDVEGETVIIDAGAPADKFDEFLPKAQKVLDTVEWKGG